MTRVVDEKLHSDAPVVVIEAAAGCGKTWTAAKLAREASDRLGSGRVLLLSHTHAACGEFQKRCHGQHLKVDVETCDSFCLKIVAPYAHALGLPVPVITHLGKPAGGCAFPDLSKKAAELLNKAPTITKSIAACYPIIVLDEHQDASTSQHAVVWLLREAGNSKLRIFGDPMQAIHMGTESYVDWDQLCTLADDRGDLDEPHRWRELRELGDWIKAARATLKAGNPLSLADVPPALSHSSHSGFCGRERFIDAQRASAVIHRFLNDLPESAVILSFLGPMVRTIAQLGRWRAPINEGAQLEHLDALVSAMEEHSGSAESLSHALLEFVAAVGVGLTGATLSGLRGRLGATVDGRRIGKNQVAWLNAFEPIYARPDHIGVSAAMKRIRDAPPAGYTVRLHGNVWALCNLGRTDDPRRYLSSLGRIRRARQLPAQAVSTIHKAKGLEFNHVLLCPVDRHQFPNGPLGARLLYVAISRACRSIRIAIAADAMSSHIRIQ